VFNQYTHFSKEPITVIPDKIQTEISPNNITKISTKIKRVGDLLRGFNLVIDLPALSVSEDDVSAIRWASYPAIRIVKEIKIIVGGSEIETLDADRIFTTSRIDMHDEQRDLFDEMVGQIPELTDPANGP